MQFFDQGLAVLRKLISEESISKINFSRAQEIADYNKGLEKGSPFSDLLMQSSSYLCLSDPAPRSEETTREWKQKLEKYNLSDVNSYINDVEEDPHYMEDLLTVNSISRECGWDPYDRLTTTQYKSQALIACGTGCGLNLKTSIDYFKPKILTIAVTAWEEFASSFNIINWVDVWNHYCLADSHLITVICADEALSLLDHIAKVNSYCLDHGFILTAPYAYDGTEKLSSLLKSDLIARSLSYFGFAMDEYNMIWNSWQSLQSSPKVFQYPTPRKLKGEYIVTGSGPSLNDAIPMLQEKQHNSIIVACASNYGTLRQNNIDVDVLCLLERGDFMVDEYSEHAKKYGTGRTKLFASCTTPYELHKLYKDAMIYFRPSLTPTSIFCNALYNILPNEGPQTINTGVAFAMSQYPESIILAGVDLGCIQKDNVRSDGAIGVSPRLFDIKVEGNLSKHAFTNDLLLDAKNVLESLAVACSLDPVFSSINLINASNGVYIEGWQPTLFSKLPLSNDHSDLKMKLDQYWSQSVEYSVDNFYVSFKMSQPRKKLLDVITEIHRVASHTNSDNFFDSSKKIISILSVADKDYQSTIGLRIIRGNITRLLAAVNRQMIIKASADDFEKQLFIDKCMKHLSESLLKFQKEVFSLFDYLESTSFSK